MIAGANPVPQPYGYPQPHQAANPNPSFHSAYQPPVASHPIGNHYPVHHPEYGQASQPMHNAGFPMPGQQYQPPANNYHPEH